MKPHAHDTNSIITIGVISDTHGLLRPEALDALQGSNLIIHAGDIGKPEVITELELIAPVAAIKGNNDLGPWAKTIPTTHSTTIGTHHIFIIHDVKQFEIDSMPTPYTIVISGHSHKPTATAHNGILFLNPGSAGPRRFSLPITLARLRLQGPRLSHEFLSLAT
jgi:uncharacterized protein